MSTVALPFTIPKIVRRKVRSLRWLVRGYVSARRHRDGRDPPLPGFLVDPVFGLVLRDNSASPRPDGTRCASGARRCFLEVTAFSRSLPDSGQ